MHRLVGILLVAWLLISAAAALAANTSAENITSPRRSPQLDTDRDGVPDTPFIPMGYSINPKEALQSKTLADQGVNCLQLWNWSASTDLHSLALAGYKLILNPFMSDLGLNNYYAYNCTTQQYVVSVDAFKALFEDTVLALIEADTLVERSVIGWNLDDEPNIDVMATCPKGQPHRKRPEDMRLFYDAIKTSSDARYREVYLNISGGAWEKPNPFVSFATCCDVLTNTVGEFRNCCGFNRYWLPSYTARALGALPETAAKPFFLLLWTLGPCQYIASPTDSCPGTAVSAKNWSLAVCGVDARCAKASSYLTPPRTHNGTPYIIYWPSYRDLRYVTYSSLLEGSRGLLYWHWGRSKCCSPDTTTRNMSAALLSELQDGLPRQAAPAILDVFTRWATDNSGGWACSRDGSASSRADSASVPGRYGFDQINYYVAYDPDNRAESGAPRRWILVAVNDCADTVSAVGFTAPISIGGVSLVSGQYDGYAQSANIGITGSGFSDDFLPWDVRVYSITSDEAN